VSPFENRLYDNSVLGVIIKINGDGRYIVKTVSGFEYFVNEHGIVK
jgi:hypothetical protein